MTYRTISVFEKPNSIIEAEIWSAPEWQTFVAMFLYDGNPYISSLHKAVSDDESYLEYHLDFFDSVAYEAWHEQWGTEHDIIRPKIFKYLRDMGVSISIYWQGECLSKDGETVQPLENFVSKITA